MRLARRKTIAEVLGVLLSLIQKCGGPGSGIPGPCPTNKPKDRKLPKVDYGTDKSTFAVKDKAEFKKAMAELVGDEDAGPRFMADALAIPNGSTVSMEADWGPDALIRVKYTNEKLGVKAVRVFGRDPDTNGLTIHGELLRVDNPGNGLGVELFRRQVEQAEYHGIEKMTIEASGSKGHLYNGYYTWARLGYDGDLPDIDLPKQFKNAERVSDLMKTPEGRAFWKEKGQLFQAEFDFDEDSQSRKVFDAYIRERQK